MNNSIRGMKATVVFTPIACERYELEPQTYRNVTEIHWNYPRGIDSEQDSGRVAFESDIHGTGITWAIDWIKELNVFPETEIAEAF